MEKQPLHSYQGFSVHLGDVAAVLSLLPADRQQLMKQTGFGDNKIRALLDYLKDFGLVKDDKRSLSELGEIIKTQDNRLTDNFTKWVCLYNWSSVESNPAMYFLLNFSRNGQTIDGLTDDFKAWASANSYQTDYKNDYAANLLKISYRALTEPEAFQDMSLVVEQQEKAYRASPYDVNVLLFGYVLYRNSKERKSISISQFMNESDNVGRFFGYSEQSLNTRLEELENLRLVQRVQNANLNMVQLNYEGQAIDFIKRYYAEN